MLETIYQSTIIAPISAFLEQPDDAVLSVISHVEGPSYRPLGAMMTLVGANKRIGTLSSGCIESDISHHAIEAKRSHKLKLIRYGLGSPFMDIQLPCGGGLEILLLPNPDRDILNQLKANLIDRVASTLQIDVVSGELCFSDEVKTERIHDTLSIRFEPELEFLVFGKGPEAATFSALAIAAGYAVTLISPDQETLESGQRAGCRTRHITKPYFPEDYGADRRTAVTLFFHDHDWEPEILKDALETNAFYIGAQGSFRAAQSRLATLEQMNVPKKALNRIKGPIGLIPSSRDSRTLAVSVLAEILELSGTKRT